MQFLCSTFAHCVQPLRWAVNVCSDDANYEIAPHVIFLLDLQCIKLIANYLPSFQSKYPWMPCFYPSDWLFAQETTLYSINIRKKYRCICSETSDRSKVSSLIRRILPEFGYTVRNCRKLPFTDTNGFGRWNRFVRHNVFNVIDENIDVFQSKNYRTILFVFFFFYTLYIKFDV